MRFTSRPAVLTAAAAVVLSGLTLAGAAPASADLYDEDCTGPSVATAPTHSPNAAPVAVDDAVTVISGGIGVFDVVGNDTDSDGDPLTLVSVSSSRYGYTCIDEGQVIYSASGDQPRSGTDKLTYAVTDGDYYRQGVLTVSYADVATAAPKVTQKLVVKKKLVKTSARIEVTNPDPTYTVHVYFGDLSSDAMPRETVLRPGVTKTIVTGRRSLDLVYVVAEPDAAALLQYASVETRTGRVYVENGGWFGEGFRSSAKVDTATRWARGAQR